MWNLTFISRDNFYKHVETTIMKYGEKIQPFDLERFNKIVIDPIKLVFDKIIYGYTWDQLINIEIFRQRDSLDGNDNNDVGFFQRSIFNYIPHCRVSERGWDVVYENPSGVVMPDGSAVRTVYVEMKNKYNTMNSSSAARTFIRMQDQLLSGDDCACFLVEAIAQTSQNIKWEIKFDQEKYGHKLIRRVSLDRFYALVTGQEDAFYQVCAVLPSVVQEIMSTKRFFEKSADTVFDELKSRSKKYDFGDEDMAFVMAIYMLGFGGYLGFPQ